MNFKKNTKIKTVYTSDPYYDLFDGGYIKPDLFLEEEDAKKISEAIELIREFLDEAQELGHLISDD